MTTTPKPHPHVDKIIQFAQDTTQTLWGRQPHEKVWRIAHEPTWHTSFPSFFPNWEYHIGPTPPEEPERMKLVFEGNAPWRVEPPEGTTYLAFSITGILCSEIWSGGPFDVEVLAAGNCWKTEADAIAYRDAYRAAAHGETK